MFTPLATGELPRMLRDHPRQSLALFVRPEQITTLVELVPAATLSRLQATASTHRSYVDATSRGAGTYLYVFVAPDPAAAESLVDRFVQLSATGEGTLLR